MQKASYIGYIKDYEGATLMHVSLTLFMVSIPQVYHYVFLFNEAMLINCFTNVWPFVFVWTVRNQFQNPVHRIFNNHTEAKRGE